MGRNYRSTVREATLIKKVAERARYVTLLIEAKKY